MASLLKYFAKNHIDPKHVDDFYAGCVGQHLEQGKNLARLSWLLAGLPDTVPGATINRLCASSLQAFHFAACTLHAGQGKVVFAGGVEHMHHVPMSAALDYSQELLARYEFPFTQMGLTAERVASDHQITRLAQDRFASESHLKAAAAQRSGFFAREILPVEGVETNMDQGPRPDSSCEALAVLKPAFQENGTVTAGNCSPVSDGASLTCLATLDACREYGLKPRAQVVATAAVGLDPLRMGMGPVPAIEKLLKLAGIPLARIGVFEINEAFASQAVACVRKLEIDPAIVNPQGGAIALGHPLGATGTRLITTLLNGMETMDTEFGVAAMCVGHGQGVATLLKRVKNNG